MVRSAREWPWSSYRASAGMAGAPDWLYVDWLLSAFGSRHKAAMEAYRRFVSEGRGARSPWEDLKRQVFLGDEAFVDSMLARLGEGMSLSETPATPHRPPPKPLAHFATTVGDRDKAIAAAYRSGGYNMQVIGDHFGLPYSMLSRIIKKEGNSRFKTHALYLIAMFANRLLKIESGRNHDVELVAGFREGSSVRRQLVWPNQRVAW